MSKGIHGIVLVGEEDEPFPSDGTFDDVFYQTGVLFFLPNQISVRSRVDPKDEVAAIAVEEFVDGDGSPFFKALFEVIALEHAGDGIARREPDQPRSVHLRIPLAVEANLCALRIQNLEDLGFAVGGTVKIITVMGGNMIVNVKETRVAVSRELAMKIMV